MLPVLNVCPLPAHPTAHGGLLASWLALAGLAGVRLDGFAGGGRLHAPEHIEGNLRLLCSAAKKLKVLTRVVLVVPILRSVE